MDHLQDESQKRTLPDLGSLYHNYRLFGQENQQLPGIFEDNQRCKEPMIAAYILWAIAKCRCSMDSEVTFAELFCADGYYAMLARHFGANRSIGIDNNRDRYSGQFAQIARCLGLDQVQFVEMDVHGIDRMECVDIVANVGGLYHVSDPKAVIEKSYHFAKSFLILQSVVSVANDQPDYFEFPAPGWDWGSRMNRFSFDNMIRSLGYHVIDRHYNELEGNDRPEDRGSVYYLIQK